MLVLSFVGAALKYTTTFPVIFLSALKYHVELQFWFSTLCPLWVLCAILNSGYSFWWDVTKDWDLGFVLYPRYHSLKYFLNWRFCRNELQRSIRCVILELFEGILGHVNQDMICRNLFLSVIIRLPTPWTFSFYVWHNYFTSNLKW